MLSVKMLWKNVQYKALILGEIVAIDKLQIYLHKNPIKSV